MAIDFNYIRENKIIVRCSTEDELNSVLADAECAGIEHFRVRPTIRDFARGVFLRFFPVGDYDSNFGWDTHNTEYMRRGCITTPFNELTLIESEEDIDMAGALELLGII